MRTSLLLKLIEILEAKGAAVAYHDPYIPVIPPTREHARLAGRESVALVPSAIGCYDAVLVATDHDGVDYASILQHAKVVIDTRGVCRKFGSRHNNLGEGLMDLSLSSGSSNTYLCLSKWQ